VYTRDKEIANIYRMHLIMNQSTAFKNITSSIAVILVLLPFFPTRSIVPDPPLPPNLNAALVNLDDGGDTLETHGCGGELASVVDAGYEQEVLRLVNEQRSLNGIPPLKRVSELDDAARYHSADLGADDYFDHDTYDRINNDLTFVCGPWDRIGSYYSGARGENIAAGYGTPEAVVNAWMNSPGHRANILSASSWEIGIGYYDGSGSYYAYWTQDFGRRSGVYPLIINADAAETDSRHVSLYVYGSWTEIRLRNNSDAWSDWMPFDNRLDWDLPDVAGVHQVDAELRNDTQTTTSSDTIFLSSATQVPILGELAEVITVTYLVSESRIIPPSIQLTPLNTGSSDPLEWDLTVDGSWFVVSPTHGSTPQSFSIIPDSSKMAQESTQPGKITVSVIEPTGVENSPQDIELHLQVISGEIRDIYIPLLINPNP
jgi:uncharacterized protein YkwD